MQTLVGDWYMPKPRRGILTLELGRERKSVSASFVGDILEPGDL